MSSSVVVAAEQYSPRRPNSMWLSVLPDLDRVPLERCGTEYRYWRCKNDQQHGLVTRIRCKNARCYSCATAKKHEQVADRMEILDRLYAELHEGVAASMLTFTMPADMWAKISPNEICELERGVVRIVEAYFGGERCISVEGQKRLPRYLIGGDVVGQWFHSFNHERKGNVWRGADLHVHVVVYSMMYDRLAETYGLEGVSKGAFVKRTLSLSRAEVNLMCYQLGQRWKAFVESLGYGTSSQTRWVVNYRYYPKRNDVVHVLDYIYRSEIQDAYREVVYNDRPPRTEAELSWFDTMINVRRPGQHRHSGFGFMANVNLNRYAKRIGLQFKRKVDRLKERRRIFCDRCGGEMETSWSNKVLTLEEVVTRGIPILVNPNGWQRKGG